jgi:hypothetical protein
VAVKGAKPESARGQAGHRRHRSRRQSVSGRGFDEETILSNEEPSRIPAVPKTLGVIGSA